MPLSDATLGQVSLVVKDLEAAQRFYVQQLGLPLLFRTDTLLFLAAGDTRIMVTAGDATQQSANSILYFRVPDLDRAWNRLRDLGVNVLQAPSLVAPMADHDLYMAFFADPDDNTLALMYEAPKGTTPACVS